MTEAAGNLRVSLAAGRLDVVIDRPQARNALSRATLEDIAAVFTRLAGQPEIKVAVLTGAGERAFAAGGDLKELDGLRTAEAAAGLFDLGQRATDAVRGFPAPVVAALNGVALGGGAELALACDFRVAGPTARIGFIQAQLALTSGFGGGLDLIEALGPRRALLHMLRADALGPADALACGLVDAVAASDETLAAAVDRFVAPILARPAALVRDLKAFMLAQRAGAGGEAGRTRERANFIRAWTDEAHWAATAKLLVRKEN